MKAARRNLDHPAGGLALRQGTRGPQHFRLTVPGRWSETARARRQAAKGLLQHEGETEALDDVLDFFETVALLVRRGAIDDEMAWHTFGYWVECYVSETETVVKAARRKHPDEFEDFLALRSRIDAREATRGNPKGKARSHRASS